MWWILLIRRLGFVSLRNFSFTCPSVPHATAVKVLHCADRLLHIPHCHSVFESLAKRNTRMTDVATSSHRAVTLCEPWPLWFAPPPHLSLRLQRSVSNWPTSEPADGTSSELLQSMSTGPAASLLPANTSAPPEVCVCMHFCMCVWPCFVTKFLFDTDCPPFVMVKTLEQVEPLGKSFKTWFDFLSDQAKRRPSFLYHWIKEIVFFVVKKTFIHPNFTPFISLEG